ncbi:MAG: hypothetical protein RR859_09365, partial [Ruthenibacterium sp.]
MMAEQRKLTAQEMRARKAKRLRKQRMQFFALSAVAILLLSGVITAVIELPGKIAAQSSSASAGSSASGETPASGATSAPPAENLGLVGPVMPETLAYQTPNVALLSLPENGRVDMSYFDDALFIGDSLTQGFQVYASGIKNAKYA